MILVGSNYFFQNMEGFKSKDKDYVRIKETGNGYKFIRQITMSGTCYFDIVKYPKEQLFEYALNNGPAMQIGKFLVPEFCQEFDITIDDLKTLSPLVDKLDESHQYEKIIYDAYIENNDFTLTDEQRLAAYESYKAARPEKEEKQNSIDDKEERMRKHRMMPDDIGIEE